jgi:hypothetical protein
LKADNATDLIDWTIRATCGIDDSVSVGVSHSLDTQIPNTLLRTEYSVPLRYLTANVYLYLGKVHPMSPYRTFVYLDTHENHYKYLDQGGYLPTSR